MAISAAMVKELRERTGAGMMECKKALTEAGGDMDAAIEALRVSGLAKADKKAGNTAAEGIVSYRISDDGKHYALVEINSQTDFAAKSEDFLGFADKVTAAVLEQQPAGVDDIMIDGQPLEEARKNLVAKIGENIQVRRFVSGESRGGQFTPYMHGVRIGVIAEIEGGDEVLGKDIAMHIAASRPHCVSAEQVPAEMVEKERSVLMAEAAESGKPAEIMEKIVDGRIRKYLAEITLLGQPFVKDTDQTVEALLKARGATVHSFERLEVGEGIEKKEENFRDEVMAQVRGQS